MFCLPFEFITLDGVVFFCAVFWFDCDFESSVKRKIVFFFFFFGKWVVCKAHKFKFFDFFFVIRETHRI